MTASLVYMIRTFAGIVAAVAKRNEARDSKPTKAQLIMWWDICRGAAGCKCGQTPCRVEGFRKCWNPACGKVQKSICGSKQCKAGLATTLWEEVAQTGPTWFDL